MCVYIYIYFYVYIYIYCLFCIYLFTYVILYIYILCLYVYVLCIYIYMCIHNVYIYTHIHVYDSMIYASVKQMVGIERWSQPTRDSCVLMQSRPPFFSISIKAWRYNRSKEHSAKQGMWKHQNYSNRI